MTQIISIQEVSSASTRIRGLVHRTPIVSSQTLSDRVGARVHLKCENLQKTGSFKVRGALNRLLVMSDARRAQGVVTVSAGNHAQAVAWASAHAGVSATVVMPNAASRAKVRACEGYGATVILLGSVFEAFDEALRLAEEEGLVFIHPFDDPEIIAGQGTVGEEILADHPETDTIVVPVGGGGLISGVAIAAAAADRSIRVIGVEPVGASSMAQSLVAGSAIRLDKVDTVADGLGSPMAGERTFAHVQSLVESIVTVTDDEILSAMGFIAIRTKLLVEPAGAAGVAALLSGGVKLSPDSTTVVILSGGNTDLSRFAEIRDP